MKRQWKRGDVALVNGEVMLCRTDGRWEHGDELRFPVTSEHARPLLIIDPESREQVERLLVASWKECGSQKRASNLDVDNAQAALRSLLAPPKPPEPMGLGAVVEDANGDLWTRAEVNGDAGISWACASDGTWHRWSKVDVVRVLSEGWVEES